MHGARNYPVHKVRSSLDVELPDACTDTPYLGRWTMPSKRYGVDNGSILPGLPPTRRGPIRTKAIASTAEAHAQGLVERDRRIRRAATGRIPVAGTMQAVTARHRDHRRYTSARRGGCNARRVVSVERGYSAMEPSHHDPTSWAVLAGPTDRLYTPGSPDAGILLGPFDPQTIENTLVTERASVEQFVRFLGGSPTTRGDDEPCHSERAGDRAGAD
jgi:hypothetical protein